MMVNYNNCADTQLCLESLVRSEVAVTIVVVDNASPAPGIREVCTIFDQVVLIENEENWGFGIANNIGMDWALNNTDAEYILILNNDTIVDNRTMAKMQSYLDTHSEVSACSPRIMYADDHNKIWYGGGGLNWRRGGARSWRIFSSYDGHDIPEAVDFITGCAMFMRRCLVEKLHGFDRRYFMYAEDVELCARIRVLGGKMAYLPTAIIHHVAHGSLKEEGAIFDDYESLANPRLEFYLEHAICNHTLVLNTYSRGLDRVIGNIWLAGKWARLCFRYTWAGRLGAACAVGKGLLRYLGVEKGSYEFNVDSGPPLRSRRVDGGQ